LNAATWLPAAGAAAEPARRLVVFPHAGAGTAPWFRLLADLPADVELRVARLPGRETRLGEPPVTSTDAAIEELARALRALPPLPLVILGHSLGALLGYGVCSYLAEAPRALVVSGDVAPSVPRSYESLHDLPDAELARAVDRRWGGIPAEIFAEPEILAIFIPALRGDLRLAEGRPLDRPPLDVPVHVFAGTEDDLDEDGLRRWAHHTRARACVVRHPGGHMAVLEDPAVTRRVLATCLEAFE
jgi:medium-chain acyl-[acyl-carrier-protein] hydrolase